mgnify:FL=1
MHIEGEIIFTLLGRGWDSTTNGRQIFHGPGSIHTHGPGSVHEPYSEDFWVIVYYQPAGAKYE